VSSLAPSAYMASAASTRLLQDLLLSHCSTITEDSSLSTVATIWISSSEKPCPTGSAAAVQKNWDRPCVDADRERLFINCSDDITRARLLATRAPHSGDWLLALPLSACGLRMDDETIRVAVSLRLGLEVCESHKCPCGAAVDPHGIHCLSCKQGPGKSLRHHQINDVVWRALTRAGVPATKEPKGLSATDDRRPDGMTLIPGAVVVASLGTSL